MKEYYEKIFSQYPDLVGIDDMRTMLGNIGRNTAYTLLQTNEINHIRVGRKYKIPPVVLVNFNILKNISKFLQNVVVLDLIEHCKPVICFQIYSLAL